MKKNKLLITMSLMGGVLLLSSCGSTESTVTENNDDVLNIYSSRHYEVDKQIADNFAEETGVKVNIVELKDSELVSKLSQEGENTEIDLVIMNGAENISSLNEMGILQPVSTVEIPESVNPKYYGDNFIGLTRRARVVVTDKEFDGEIKNYDDLTSPELANEILVRSSGNAYNQALVASFLQQNGEEYTKEWVSGFVSNFARKPEGNDRDQVKAVANGDGSVAVVNSYYLHLLANSTEPSEVEAVEAVTPISLENVHENISWVGIVDPSEEADEFIEYLLNEENQSLFMELNGEYPVNSNVELTGYISTLPEYTYQDIDFETLGDYREDAYKLMLEQGWE